MYRSLGVVTGWLVCLGVVLGAMGMAGADEFDWLGQSLAERDAPRAIGAVSTLTNVFPDEPPVPASLSQTVELCAARNESQSARIVIVAGADLLTVKRVEVSDLETAADCSDVIGGDAVGVRLARFRDGVDDDDYLMLLELRCPDGLPLRNIRKQGRGAYGGPEPILNNRDAIAKWLDV